MKGYQARFRLIIYRAVIVLIFAVFAAQLWRLQVVHGEEYRLLADRNRFRLEQLEAPRGVIYDRTGRLLVENVPTYRIVIIPAYLPEERQAEILERLSSLLGVPLEELRPQQLSEETITALAREVERRTGREVAREALEPAEPAESLTKIVERGRLLAPYQPVVVKTGVDRSVASIIEEEHLDLSGVLVEIVSARQYMAGELTSHVLGYVGSIPQELLEEYEGLGYTPTDRVGLTGLELVYEDVLRGEKGLENIEVDWAGRKVSVVGEPTLAVEGQSLVLTLDLNLQEAMYKALAAGMKEAGSKSAVAIAMNPQTGEILGMASLPTYDNNMFSRGISAEEYAELSVNRFRPMVNHAVSAQYPPGSTYKIIPATAALQEKIVEPDTYINCPGVIWVPNKFFPDDPSQATPFYCWDREGHGLVNFITGLAESCDVYFYHIAAGYGEFEGLGLDRLVEYSHFFGLGEPTGIDLPGESAGLVPTVKWKRLNYGDMWVTGDTYNMGIGQGYVLVTPLQMLNATAAIANGGTLYRPYIVSHIIDSAKHVIHSASPQVIRRLPVDRENIDLVRDGLWAGAVWGTAAEELNVPSVSVAGKTGTAEFCDDYPKCLDREGRVRTSHAWFSAFAPVENPRIALVVFIYGGGEGSKTAVPVAGEILRYYFGLEEPEEQKPAAEDAGKAEAAQPLAEGRFFRARLLGAEAWSGGGAALFGRVLDADGRGLADLTVSLEAGGEPVGEVRTATDGAFSYDALDPNAIPELTLRLADYPQADPLMLYIAAGRRYLVQFEVVSKQ
jgi:penicillin-binding protein 2